MALRKIQTRRDQAGPYPQDLRGYGDALRSLAPRVLLTLDKPVALEALDELAADFSCESFVHMPQGDVQLTCTRFGEAGLKRQILQLFALACALYRTQGRRGMALHVERSTMENPPADLRLQSVLEVDAFVFEVLSSSGLQLYSQKLEASAMDEFLKRFAGEAPSQKGRASA